MWELEISQCENLKFYNVKTRNFVWELEISQCENLKFHKVKTGNFTMRELEIHNVRTWNFTMWKLEISVTYEQNNHHRNNQRQKTLLVFKPSIYRRQSYYYPISQTEFRVMYCMAAEHMQIVIISTHFMLADLNPYPTAFPYGNGMVLHFYQQQESSTNKTVHKVINKGLKTYV